MKYFVDELNMSIRQAGREVEKLTSRQVTADRANKVYRMRTTESNDSPKEQQTNNNEPNQQDTTERNSAEVNDELVIDEFQKSTLRIARKIKTKRREEKRLEREQQKADTEKLKPTLEGEKYKLILEDFRNASFLVIEKNSIDAIVTDPPYGIEYLPLYENLSQFASHVLKPNAPCLVMVGQSWLGQAIGHLSSALNYNWTLSYFTPGKSTQIFPRKIKSNWKPVIFLVNGNNECEHVNDYINAGKYDKSYHDWGQTENGMAQIIERITVKGDLILDPFCGAGTTGVSALKLERKFIGIDNDEYAIKQSGLRLENL